MKWGLLIEHVSLITGRPGIGKTMLMSRVAMEWEGPVAVISPSGFGVEKWLPMKWRERGGKVLASHPCSFARRIISSDPSKDLFGRTLWLSVGEKAEEWVKGMERLSERLSESGEHVLVLIDEIDCIGSGGSEYEKAALRKVMEAARKGNHKTIATAQVTRNPNPMQNNNSTLLLKLSRDLDGEWGIAWTLGETEGGWRMPDDTNAEFSRAETLSWEKILSNETRESVEARELNEVIEKVSINARRRI